MYNYISNDFSQGQFTFVQSFFWYFYMKINILTLCLDIYQWFFKLQLEFEHLSSLSLNADTNLVCKRYKIAFHWSSHLSKGCLTMIKFVDMLENAICLIVAPSTTGATTLACSLGCLKLYWRVFFCFIVFKYFGCSSIICSTSNSFFPAKYKRLCIQLVETDLNIGHQTRDFF